MKTIILFLFISVTAYSQNYTDRSLAGEAKAKEHLKKTLADPKVDNMVGDNIVLIDDKETALSIAEVILFKIYGKEEMKKQKPFEIYKDQSHWIIMGTLPNTAFGSTALCILDSRNAKIVKVHYGN